MSGHQVRPSGRRNYGRWRGRGDMERVQGTRFDSVSRRSYQEDDSQAQCVSLRQPRSSIKYLSQADITSLAQSSPADVLACVTENESGFLAAYRHDRNCDKPLMVKHMIKMLYLLVKTDNLDRIASRILARIFSPDATYAVFLFKIDQLIKKMVTESRGHIRRENPQYLNYLAEIGIKAITIIPETVLSTFPLLSIKETVLCLSRDGDTSDSLKKRVESLETMFSVAREERKRGHIKYVGDKDSVAGPSECFVDVSILPSLSEVFSEDSKIYLRPNIVKGAYEDWDHYLDVQYRLMREDFLRPLRHGIQHFFSPGNRQGKRTQNIRVYEEVRLLNPVCLFSGVGFQAHFDVSHFTKVKWEHSKRLIFGSLLCLSKDCFQHSIMFASVVKRDPALLKDGFITVKFEGDTSGFHFNPYDVFTMVESMAYYEAYRHILSKLKAMSSTSDAIPFKSYIVECKLRDIPVPLYASHRKHLQFDLRSILDIESPVMINDLSSWPSPSSTCLDESQLDALRIALTKEVSVIQGPPGTGKTFIGLKVVEAFLRNRSSWDRNRESPILVVCYTNHALDQFLEGIQKITLEGKPKIVRIGGRCKSEQLSNCILRKKVEEFRSKQELPRPLLQRLNEAHCGMQASRCEIRQLLSNSSGLGRSVQSLLELKSVILDRHYKQLQALYNEEGRVIEVWLELCYPSFSEAHPNDLDRADISMVPASEENGNIESLKVEETGLTSVNFKSCIDVDDEAKVLEEDRIIEGEEIELSGPPQSEKAKEKEIFEIGWNFIDVDQKKRDKMIKDGLNSKRMTIDEVCSIQDVCGLSRKRKWELYCYWVNQNVQYGNKHIQKLTDQYDQWCEVYADCRSEVDKYVLHGTDVIGMTTTGAAKHHHILRNIHPKIVIFEEAAEIFESHIVTSLSPSVQQLVLIGDHKQLRPKPNSYDMDVKYGLAVSLFERLVRNGINYVTLGVQHRMRPEISCLIHPSIYSELKDHTSVTSYENIRGIAKNVFMITHTQPEKNEHDSDVTTRVNEFEAKYLVALCHYLLKQGYQTHQITVLTMYQGQLFELRGRMTRETFQGVRVAAVDDFQGEENDIILLSLVRSNVEKIIGFLDKRNRICVSLSRAKEGLYIIGNLDMLRDKESTVWPEIISDLEQKGCVGNSLPLYCQVHNDSKVWAKIPEDFLKCPEGGCEKMCKARLSCGHVCPRICHPKDNVHQNYKCLNECNRMLPCGHRCDQKCYECFGGCRPCSATVKRIIPLCGHKVTMPCCSDPSTFPCPILCDNVLPCGHACQNHCSRPCTIKCLVKVVDKVLLCGHKVESLCYQTVKCPQKCNAILDCGHKCTGTCGECHMGRMHKSCSQNCGRQLVCGHACDFPCASTCPPCMKSCNNFCIHSFCRKKCYELCTPCMERCMWQCKHFKCTRRCSEICDRPPCDQPCENILKCGHPCISLCGEKCPSLCRICDKEVVCDIFFGTEEDKDARFIQLEDCGHLIEVRSLDTYLFRENKDDHPDEVKFIDCPKCRTPIRTSLRYCNKVKSILKDVEEIKLKQLVPMGDLKEKLSTLTVQAKTSNMSFIEKEIASLTSSIARSNLHPYRVNTMLVQIGVLSSILGSLDISSGIKRSTASKLKGRFMVCDMDRTLKNLHLIKSCVFQEFLSNQQVLDVTCEARRMSCAVKLCDLLCKLEEKKCQLSPDNEPSIMHCVQIVQDSGLKREKLSPDSESSIMDVIKHISDAYQVNGISDQERTMIVKAIGLSKGHWYKCANGHYYCIGECGGATETSKCPDCGLVIGGRSHQLASGNEHAPDMDNSRHAAWSEGANLGNFNLDNNIL